MRYTKVELLGTWRPRRRDQGGLGGRGGPAENPRISSLPIRTPAASAVIVLALCAGPAEAARERITVRQGPFVVGPYQVRFTSPHTRYVRAPRLDGWLVRMRARVVDKGGRPLPVQRVMLHHVLYKNRAHRDPVCGGSESFYGTGEENQALELPRGYGYRIRRGDRWSTAWMLMNHRSAVETAYIQYTAVIDTRRHLRPVRPYWVRATGCHGARDPIFNVPGGGRPGAIFRRSALWRVPASGRIVAAGAHVHGGARLMALTQPRCGNRPLLESRPLYGMSDHPYYNVLPVLHEPGPIATGWTTTSRGIPIRKGERLRAVARYDAERPHTRVMGIWHVYVAAGRAPRHPCRRLPADVDEKLPEVPGRRRPPPVRVPLTGLDGAGRAVEIQRPPGRLVRAEGSARVVVKDAGYGTRNLSVARGASVTWRFDTVDLHDVTLADGPVGFASRWSRGGERYRRRFSVPGTYKLFCSLHPIRMTQVIEVRAGRAG